MTTTAGADRSRLSDVTASVLLMLPVVATLAAFGAWRDRLPDPLPRHWNFAGEVDGTAGLVTFAAWVVGVVGVLAVVGLVLVWVVRSLDVAGFSVALVGGLAWFMSALFIGTLAVSLDAARAEDVALPLLPIVAGGLVALAVGFALAKLVPMRQVGGDVVATHRSSLSFAGDERVVWVGTASSRGLRWIGIVMAVLGGAATVVAGPLSLVFLVVGLAMAMTSTVTTRIDDDGVHVSWTAFGLLGTTTPWAEIAGVEVTRARPAEWGGWGYRVSSRGSAHLVRAGEAIVLRRSGRKDLLITVDGAEQARDVVAGLIAREAARP